MPDGSLLVRPDPARAASFRMVFLAAVAVDLVLAVGCFVAGTAVHQLSALRLAAVLALVAAVTMFFLLQRYVPRGVKADGHQVAYLSLVDRSVTRSDLALMFRADAWTPSRAGGSWVKSYVFARRDGKVAFSCPAVWFPEDGMSQLARQLDIPIRGDFTVRVKDQVDLASS